MRWYFVPPNLNEGSAFQQHLVLVWTTVGHTYAYGFHGVDTIADARALDLELVRLPLQRTAMKEGLLGDTLQVSTEERAQGGPT